MSTVSDPSQMEDRDEKKKKETTTATRIKADLKIKREQIEVRAHQAVRTAQAERTEIREK